jgi:hypothetical protein
MFASSELAQLSSGPSVYAPARKRGGITIVDDPSKPDWRDEKAYRRWQWERHGAARNERRRAAYAAKRGR